MLVSLPGICNPVPFELAEHIAAEQRQGHALLRVGTDVLQLALDEPDLPCSGYRLGWDDQGRPTRDFAGARPAAVLAAHQALHRRLPRIRSKNRSTEMPNVDVDALLERLSRDQVQTSAPSWAGVRHRAAEHVVTAPGTGAATTHGTFDIGTGWAAALAAEWTTAAMPITANTSVAEVDPGRGLPALAVVEIAPAPAPQNGEKQELESVAFKVSAADTTTIDSTLYLNWSMQLEQTNASAVGQAMMQAAVAAEADRQVGAVIVAEAAAAADLDSALAVFDDGRYLPSVLLLPPSLLGDYQPTNLAAAGVRTVLAHVTKAVLLSPSAVTGWLVPLTATAIEAKVLGIGKAYSLYGAVAVDPTGAAVIG